MPTIARLHRLGVLLLALLGATRTSVAASLAEDVGRLKSPLAGETVQGRYVADLLPMSQVMPSSTPGWALTWDAASGQLVPADSPAGPIFTERATTLGAGAFLLHATYQDLNFKRVDGHRLRDTLVKSWFDGGEAALGQPFRGINPFELYQRMFVVGATYGVTDTLDVAVDLPTIHTRLYGRGGFDIGSNDAPTLTSVQDWDTGIGDLLLRGKWQAPSVGGVALALGLGLRLPSGDPDNFRGTGTVGVIPSVIASRSFGPAALHAELGFDVDGSDAAATRARYRLGGTVQALPWLGFSAELVGSSGVATRVDTVGEFFGTTHFEVPRTDVVDGVYAFQVSLFGHLTAFAGVDVPITSDGMRPTLVPLGGLSANF